MNKKSVVILTGAGISQESGIKTFRDSNGLWENHTIEEVATPEGFQLNPKLVYEFYNARRRQLLGNEVKENSAHRAIAEFEKKWTGQFLLITQNVDDLHQRAGSKNLLHMHGELLKMRCLQSGLVFSIEEDLIENTKCTCCKVPSSLRPHIVWFGEIPFAMDRIHRELQNCDFFISIGTSGQVYPVAGFVQYAKQSSKKIEINLDATPVSCNYDEKITGRATEKVPEVLAKILSLFY